MTEQNKNNNSLSPREDVINTAVKFLQNPKVVPSPLKQKEEFLKSKGLSDEEITRSFAIVDKIIADKSSNEFTAVALPANYQHYHPQYPQYQQQIYPSTVLQRVRDIFNTAAFIGTTFYCVYWFYKKFIEPLLFGKKKEVTLQERVTELDKTVKTSVEEIKESIIQLEDSIQEIPEKQNQTSDPTVKHLIQELKQDLASLKGLLLSRKQFPSAPASIPAWQLEAGAEGREKSGDREDDAGSGSSTNNSDSSLEMIREDPPK